MAKNIAKGGHDNYPTPLVYAEWAVQRALSLRSCAPEGPYKGLEPGCGASAPFMQALSNAVSSEAVGVEKESWSPIFKALDRDAKSDIRIFSGTDFLSKEQESKWLTNSCLFDIIATNPPFSVCEAFMEKSLRLLKPTGVMVFLLRMAIMGSKKRLDFWEKNMPFEIAHFVRRISFDGVRTDYAEYACFFWLGSELASHWKGVRGAGTSFYLVDNRASTVRTHGRLLEIWAPTLEKLEMYS